MDHVICKADIKPVSRKKFGIIALCVVLVFMALVMIPIHKRELWTGFYRYENILGFSIGWQDERDGFYLYSVVRLISIIPLAIVGLGWLYGLIVKRTANQCELTLTDRGVNGQRKKTFSMATLNLPMDKIDNIGVSVTLFNKLTGGKTVAIRSASGLVKFPWVQNADEFVEKALAEIEKYKNNAPATQSAAPTTPQTNQSLTEKMTELKNLLQQGLLTQEEFDRKKQDLIDKM